MDTPPPTMTLQVDTTNLEKMIKPLLDEVNDLRDRVAALERMLLDDGR